MADSVRSKKVDPRVRMLAERAVAGGHRSLYVIVGDNGRDQVVNLHFMMQRLSARKGAPVLWCYKKELGFASNKSKRTKEVKQAIHKNQYNQQIDDPFQLFLASNDIRFCYYKETDKILGRTFSMCVLQDFEALTPNVLCRTVETVEGGGMVILLLKTMDSLKQLYSVAMDSHKKFADSAASGVHTNDIEPRFNERFLLSLADCKSCLVMDDEMNVLALSNSTLEFLSKTPVETGSDTQTHKETVALEALVQKSTETSPVLGKLVSLAKTSDQAKVIQTLADAVIEKTLKHTIALTAGRGRGKSAALGLAIAAALSQGYSSIAVTAPVLENVQTLFEFVIKGLKTLGFKEHLDFSVTSSSAAGAQGEISQSGESQAETATVSKISVYRTHRQTVTFASPETAATAASSGSGFELLVVDEAAAIPLPTVKAMLVGNELVMLGSTVQGYEGTGRALALKLIQDMKKASKLSSGGAGRTVKEVSMSVPIRYSPNDGVEKWLNDLLCLDAVDGAADGGLGGLRGKMVMPEKCRLYMVNRDTLFSYHKASENFLRRLVGLFVGSHYKNSPNDLLLMSDAPKHHLLVLLPPVDEESTSLPDIYVAVQVAVEGAIAPSELEEFAQRGVVKPAGDMIPWTLSQQFHDTGFGQLNGVRVVRVATHPALDKKGYGSEAVKQLVQWLQTPGREETSKMHARKNFSDNKHAKGGLLNEELAPRTNLPPLLDEVSKVGSLYGSEVIDYVGTSFGLTLPLFNFWNKNGFKPLYVRQSANETTGEHSCVMLRPLRDADWCNALRSDFSARFFRLLGGGTLRKLPVQLAASVAQPGEGEVEPALPVLQGERILQLLSRHDVHRLELYAKNVIDHFVISDLVPVVSELVILRRIPGLTGISPVQQAILLALGAQRKSFEFLASELDLPVSQLLAMFNKAMCRISAHINKALLDATRAEVGLSVSSASVRKPLPGISAPRESLSAEQEKAAQVVKAEHAEKRRKLLEEQKKDLERKFGIGGALDAVELDEETPGRVQVRKEKTRGEERDERPKKKHKKQTQ